MTFSRPRAIQDTDNPHGFDCGNDQLNTWLRSRALANERLHVSRTYVTIDTGTSQIAGFYSLAMHSIARTGTVGRFRRNAPDPVPVVLLGQLAVDNRYRGQRLGTALLVDAVRRAGQAAASVGARAVVTEAIDAAAVGFYEHHGMTRLAEGSHLLFLLLRTAERRAE